MEPRLFMRNYQNPNEITENSLEEINEVGIASMNIVTPLKTLQKAEKIIREEYPQAPISNYGTSPFLVRGTIVELNEHYGGEGAISIISETRECLENVVNILSLPQL